MHDEAPESDAQAPTTGTKAGRVARIHSDLWVDVDAAVLWRTLTSTRWDWSGFMVGFDVAPDRRHATLRLRGLPRGIPIRVRLVAHERERELRWVGGIPGVFTGEHYLRLHRDGAGTRIEHGEVFEGVLGARAVPPLADRLTKLYADDVVRLAESARAGGTHPAASNIPTGAHDLTASWLECALAERHPGVRVRAASLAGGARAGDGVASTADRLAIDVEYEDGGQAGLPTRMLLKTIVLSGGLRVGPMGFRMLGATIEGLGRTAVGRSTRDVFMRAMTRFQERFPQAPDAMYETEVRFYRDVRPELTLETPASYAAVRDPQTLRFGVLMEDLGLRGAHFPTAEESGSVESMRALLGTLAALHAQLWQSPRLSGDLSWVPTSTSGGMFEIFHGLGRELIRAQLALYPFKRRLLAPVGHELDAMWDAMWATQRAMCAEPQTLLHGDTHVGNTYRLPDGSVGLLDWQLMMRGCFIHDVTYAMVSGLPVEVRRREERALLAHYLAALAARGVVDVPSLEHAFELHRRAVSWGLLIGWMITPPQNYGEAITSANLERLVAAAVDLGTFEPRR